jgi:imidazolonepropionase-like amidohydrolase
LRFALSVLPCLLIPLILLAASSPAAAQTYAITGAKIYTLAGPPIASGTVVIQNGKITAVGANVRVPSGAQVISARGLQVYPGIFNAVSELGLVEVPQGMPGSVDDNELGTFNPQLVAASAILVESEHIPVTRFTGVTHTMTVPGLSSGAVFSGQGSVIHLAGWVIEELLIRKSTVMAVNWPSLRVGGGGFGGFGGQQQQRRTFTEIRQEYDRRVAEIEDWLERARHYAQATEKGSAANFTRDLKLEALVPVVKGQLPLLVNTNDARDIRNAIEFAEKHKLRIVIAGGRDAWKIKDFLKQKNVGVILGATQALPSNEDEPYDKPLTRAGELAAAGVKIAFGTFDTQFARNLPFEAANAVPFGLPWEEALKAITIHPAQLLGLDKELGTIETGKIGNLIVTTGDPLEYRSEVRYVFINGKPASLDNKHKQLYEKYRNRP